MANCCSDSFIFILFAETLRCSILVPDHLNGTICWDFSKWNGMLKRNSCTCCLVPFFLLGLLWQRLVMSASISPHSAAPRHSCATTSCIQLTAPRTTKAFHVWLPRGQPPTRSGLLQIPGVEERKWLIRFVPFLLIACTVLFSGELLTTLFPSSNCWGFCQIHTPELVGERIKCNFLLWFRLPTAGILRETPQGFSNASEGQLIGSKNTLWELDMVRSFQLKNAQPSPITQFSHKNCAAQLIQDQLFLR